MSKFYEDAEYRKNTLYVYRIAWNVYRLNPEKYDHYEDYVFAVADWLGLESGKTYSPINALRMFRESRKRNETGAK